MVLLAIDCLCGYGCRYVVSGSIEGSHSALVKAAAGRDGLGKGEAGGNSTTVHAWYKGKGGSARIGRCING